MVPSGLLAATALHHSDLACCRLQVLGTEAVSGMLPVCSVRDVPGLYPVAGTYPPPTYFISVDSKRFRFRV